MLRFKLFSPAGVGGFDHKTSNVTISVFTIRAHNHIIRECLPP